MNTESLLTEELAALDSLLNGNFIMLLDVASVLTFKFYGIKPELFNKILINTINKYQYGKFKTDANNG